ncbi:unnamed protein product [Cylicostephanus goldi]|uniref:Branched-chain-amino-acid aminotransferase n=1 Tax=Cylicostephanus goldi TaxID=71465 RepID=A0A3P6RT50_CYLGO|nr:unnamed protein product [Cylicostephanus goldi]
MLEVDYEEEKGMKAYRGDDNHIRLFRPELNMARMRKTAERSAFPDFDGNELLECMKEWVSDSEMQTCYLCCSV